jgi:amidase/6-aminohexanoate-cyclic-dimer hydrolase
MLISGQATGLMLSFLYDQAKVAIAAGLPSGPFAGVPYLLKDIGPLYAGTITTLGSSAFRNFVPDHDSEMVVRLKQAGPVIFGKTHAPEFGLSTSSESRLFGATREHDEDRYRSI